MKDIVSKNNVNRQSDKIAEKAAAGLHSNALACYVWRWIHKLFKCPTFWKLKPSFTCPGCNKRYRCYWDGNDVIGHGIDYCNKCARKLET